MLSDIVGGLVFGLVVSIIVAAIVAVVSIYAEFIGWILERLGW